MLVEEMFYRLILTGPNNFLSAGGSKSILNFMDSRHEIKVYISNSDFST